MIQTPQLNFDRLIAQLLYDYDCVVVPQLGGFVTNYRPAHLDEGTGVLHPARKDVSFNKNLSKSDGLLEKALAEHKGLSFEEASQQVRDEVSACWARLHGGDTLKFKKVGILFIDSERNLRFEPSHDTNFLKQSFGFDAFIPQVIARPDQGAETLEREEALPRVAAVVAPKVSRNPSSAIYWVAAATMLPFLAMSAYIGLSTQFKSPTELTMAELVPLFRPSETAPTYAPRTQGSIAEPLAADPTHFPEAERVFPFSFETNAPDSTGVWVNLSEVNALPAARPEVATGPYHIIAGCFGERANADKLIEALREQGFDAALLDRHRGLFRVKLVSYSDYTQALNELDKLRSLDRWRSAWLLKKPV